MRRRNTEKLSEAISAYLKEMQMEKKLQEIHVINTWEELAGKAIARRTKSVRFHQGVLYINLTSSVVRNELLMIREALKEKINSQTGEELVKDIVLR